MEQQCVYVLRSERTGRYYIGSTNDVARRLERHNAGLVKSTRASRPWLLVYTEPQVSRTEARNREAQLKRWKSHRALSELIQRGPGFV